MHVVDVLVNVKAVVLLLAAASAHLDVLVDAAEHATFLVERLVKACAMAVLVHV